MDLPRRFLVFLTARVLPIRMSFIIFAQKFTANWLFMINATESELPRVNQPSRDRLSELEPEWAALRARGDAMLNDDIQALNRRLFDLGVGAIKAKKPVVPGKIG